MRDTGGRFVKGGAGIEWHGLETMADRIQDVAENMELGAKRSLEVLEARILTYAIENAPWKDRTYNARRGLHTVVIETAPSTFTLWLGHTVYYGVYLETKWGGRYAIIVPTLLKFSAELGSTLKDNM